MRCIIAQIKPEFDRLPEYNEIAQRLIERYPDTFFGIEVERICAYLITNKERKETNPKLFEMQAVKMPIALDCKYSHYVVIHANDWFGMELKHKALLVSQTLCAIALDDNGEMEAEKVQSFDLKDYSRMIRTFGADYLVRNDVPDILQEEIAWKE